MRTPVRFYMADGERKFDGFATGDTWNGFDVILVTAEVRDQLIIWCSIPESICCEHPFSSHAPDPAETRQIATNSGPVTVTGEPVCARCSCREFDDGAAQLSTIPADADGLFDLLGYVTSIATEEPTDGAL